MIFDEDNFHVLFVVVDQRKRKHQEGIELDRFILALWAIYDRLVLSVQQIYNDRLISLHKALPSLSCDDLIRSPIVILCLNVRLFLDSIQVLVQTIEEIVDQFAGIMLVVA